MKRMLFVYNPRAGHGLHAVQLSNIISICSEEGYLVTVYPTKEGYCFDELREYITVDTTIVYAGGDGILNAAVNFQLASLPDADAEDKGEGEGYLEQRFLENKKIVYLPLGTTNDFARNLEFSGSPDKFLQRLLRGGEEKIDVGVLNGKYFVYAAAFGRLTDISYDTPQGLKNSLGYFAYLLEVLKRMPDLKSWYLKIRAYDENGEERLIEGDFALGMITNSVSVAGLKRLFAGGVSLSDGLFEVLLLKRPKNISDLGNIAAVLILPQNEVPDTVLRFKANRIYIESAEELSWTLDGEYGGTGLSLDIDVLREKINIAVTTD